jgi:hypothetical protein
VVAVVVAVADKAAVLTVAVVQVQVVLVADNVVVLQVVQVPAVVVALVVAEDKWVMWL